MDTLAVYYSLETLLMLLDGQFYPTLNVYNNDTEITYSWKKRSLPSYYSAAFMMGSGNKLVDFEAVVNAELFQKWNEIKDELDLIHKMVLYCLSSVQMPKDMQCAFMTEAFEGLSELISRRKSEIVFAKAKRDESQLKLNLLTYFDRFGNDIFQKEMESSADNLAQILVDSRNKIAHIKSKQDRVYLDGAECVMYLMKLSLLYRVVLFDLLGIDNSLFSDRLRLRVQAINDHDTMKNFLKKLGENNA